MNYKTTQRKLANDAEQKKPSMEGHIAMQFHQDRIQEQTELMHGSRSQEDGQAGAERNSKRKRTQGLGVVSVLCVLIQGYSLWEHLPIWVFYVLMLHFKKVYTKPDASGSAYNPSYLGV
jgi:hypothetical protein